MVTKTILLVSITTVFIGTFAQDNDKATSDKTSGQNDNAAATTITPTASVAPMEDALTQEINKRYTDYKKWFFENVYPLAKEAERNGMQATQEEMASQQRAFKAMFPGMPADGIEVNYEVLAKKYSSSLYGTTLSQGNVQNAYTQLKSGYSNEPMPSFSEVQSMLETRALLENRSVQEKLIQINEQKAKAQNETMVEASQNWPIEDLMIHAPDNECLAQYKDSDVCLLTVKKFNDYIRYREIQKIFSIDTARMWAIKEILKDFYIAHEARDNKVAKGDSMENEKRDWIQMCLDRLKYRDIGIPVTDRASLTRTYSFYYNALFRERRFPFFSIIGSSDSLSIDSIWHALKRDTAHTTVSLDDASKNADVVGGRFPWVCSRMEQIPEGFGKNIDTIPIKGMSGIIRTPYGFFIVRLDSVQIQPEKKFEEVIKDLIYLTTKRKWKNLDSQLVEKAYRIYASNRRLSQTPDTLKVIAYLTPNNGQSAFLSEEKSPGDPKNKKNLLEKKNELHVCSTQLPMDVRDSLLNQYGKNRNKKCSFGPIASSYGVWYFKILDVHYGKGSVPFSLTKKNLVDSLLVRELEFCPPSYWQNPDSTLSNTALARSYAPFFFGLYDDMDQNTTNGGNAGTNSAAGSGKESLKQIKMNKFRSRVNELEEWLSRISIHLLGSG